MASLTVGISTHSTRANIQKMFSTTTQKTHLLKARPYAFIEDGDTQVIAEKTDFLGINYYNRAVIASDTLEESRFIASQMSVPKCEQTWDGKSTLLDSMTS